MNEEQARELLQEALDTIDALMTETSDLREGDTDPNNDDPDDIYMAAGNTRDRIKDFLNGDDT